MGKRRWADNTVEFGLRKYQQGHITLGRNAGKTRAFEERRKRLKYRIAGLQIEELREGDLDAHFEHYEEALSALKRIDTEAYYVQLARDEHGSAVRDNSRSELVAIGKALEAENE